MLILVTGGAASGKSAYAERILCARAAGARLYVATMQPYGEEAQMRIARHHRLRAGRGFDTAEQYEDLQALRLNRQYDGILLEDLGNLLANEQFSANPDGAAERVIKGVLALENQCKALVAVTNEVFADGLPYPTETVCYVRALAWVNRALAARADAAVEVVCGIPVPLKGGERL